MPILPTAPKRLATKALLLGPWAHRKYSPSQPRDWHGRWSGPGVTTARLDRSNSTATNVEFKRASEGAPKVAKRRERAGYMLTDLEYQGAEAGIYSFRDDEGRLLGLAKLGERGDYVDTPEHESVSVVWVDDLATPAPGSGRAVMQTIVDMAASRALGVGLVSTGEAKGFYTKLGMRSAGEAVAYVVGLYYWTPEDVQLLRSTKALPHVGAEDEPEGSEFTVRGARPLVGLKYSPSQPRVPAGSSGGGRRAGGGGGRSTTSGEDLGETRVLGGVGSPQGMESVINRPAGAAWEAGADRAFETMRQLKDSGEVVGELEGKGSVEAKGAKVNVMRDLAADTGLPESVVAELIKQWSYTSNDDDYRALWLQKMAAEEFGVELSEWQAAKIAEMEE